MSLKTMGLKPDRPPMPIFPGIGVYPHKPYVDYKTHSKLVHKPPSLQTKPKYPRHMTGVPKSSLTFHPRLYYQTIGQVGKEGMHSNKRIYGKMRELDPNTYKLTETHKYVTMDGKEETDEHKEWRDNKPEYDPENNKDTTTVVIGIIGGFVLFLITIMYYNNNPTNNMISPKPPNKFILGILIVLIIGMIALTLFGFGLLTDADTEEEFENSNDFISWLDNEPEPIFI